MNNTISPITDIVFKHIFGSEKSTRVLRSFLSAVQVDAGFLPIDTVDIRNPFNVQSCSDDKLSIVDLRARDAAGKVFTIEMQVDDHPGFLKRSLYYWARVYGTQLKEGQDYSMVEPVVGVNVLGFELFPPRVPKHSTFTLRLMTNPSVELMQDAVLHYLELSKPGDGPSTPLERWMYYLWHRGGTMALNDPMLLQILQQDPEIEDAEALYQEFLANDMLRERYMDRDKAKRDELWRMNSMLRKGLEKGIEQGIEQGIRQGQINVLVRLLKHRFNLSASDEQHIRACRDSGAIEQALDLIVEPGTTKDQVMTVLTNWT